MEEKEIELIQLRDEPSFGYKECESLHLPWLMSTTIANQMEVSWWTARSIDDIGSSLMLG